MSRRYVRNQIKQINHLVLPPLCFFQGDKLPAILEKCRVARYVFLHDDPIVSARDRGLFQRCGRQPQRDAVTFFHEGATVETTLVKAESRFLGSQPWVLESNWGIRKTTLRASMGGVEGTSGRFSHSECLGLSASIVSLCLSASIVGIRLARLHRARQSRGGLFI